MGPVMKINPTIADDIPALQDVLTETGLFPSDVLPEMIKGFLTKDDEEAIWLSCLVSGKAMGFCYAAPEQLADGAWNMLAIAVAPAQQANGIGAALVKRLETILQDRKARILVADTSGGDDFAQTRDFYRKNGYNKKRGFAIFGPTAMTKLFSGKNFKMSFVSPE